MPFGTDEQARDVLAHTHTWAVVGLRPSGGNDAYAIGAWLQDRGKRVIPIHPYGGEALGEPVYPNLQVVPDRVDVVDIFRRSDQAGAHVDEAIELGASAVWLQLGVADLEAAARAKAAGLTVLMDRCPRIDGPRLLGWPS